MKKMVTLMAVTALSITAYTGSAQAEVVKLYGATTVVDRVIKPHQAAVESKTKLSLEIVGNATGKGLIDLVSGHADAALCSEPLDIAVLAAKTAGKKVDIKQLVFTVVKQDEIVFIVNPANTVGKLTLEQIKDIHTGKIKNWKEVGGKDAPISVYADTPTGGTRAMIKQIVMKGADYAGTVSSQASVKKVGDMVAADPYGFGGLGKGFADSRVKIVTTDKVPRPLGFITMGAPKGNTKTVIDAFKAEAAKAGK